MAALALLAVATYTLPWLAREDLRGAVYDVQTYMQLARIEAVSRNRICRFVLDTNNRRVGVLDSNGTPVNYSDDILLYEADLPDTISFARPDTGSAVTLHNPTGSIFQTMFSGDGIVRIGTGTVSMLGGDRYTRVSVFGAGGLQVQRWNGTTWVAGS